jgi:hypothetical protein
MRSLVLLFLSLGFLSQLSVAGELALTVPPLVTEQPILESIFRIGDIIIVSTEKYDRKNDKLSYSYWQLDEQKNQWIPLVNNAGDHAIAVSENGDSDVIAFSRGDRIELKFVNQPERSIDLKRPSKSSFRMSAHGDYLFLVFVDRIAQISRNGKIRQISLKDMLPELRNSYATKRLIDLPRAIAATKNELLLGYDKGEFGGYFYSIEIEKKGLAANAKLLMSENVSAIDQDSEGRLWIAGSLLYEECGLYSYDGKTMSPVVSESNLENEKERVNGDLIIFDNSPRFEGVIINSNDEAVFIYSDAGLFSYTPGKPLTNLWEGNLDIEYRMPNEPNVIIISGPQGIVEKGKVLYLAERSLGVICFEKIADGKYVPVKQITFDEAHKRSE